MKSFFLPFFVLVSLVVGVGCGNQSENTELTAEQTEALAVLDSIHKLDPKAWIAEANHIPDSVYGSQQKLRIKLTTDQMLAIKEEGKAGQLSMKLLRLFAPDEVIADERVSDGKTWVFYHEFSSDKFAIQVTDGGWEDNVYFFDFTTVVAKHHIFHKYGLEIETFRKDTDYPIVYYKQNFESGTGVWWWNYNFFSYAEPTKVDLGPVWNTLQNSIIANPGDGRMFGYEASIVKTSPEPIEMKVVYNVQIPGEHDMEYVEIIKDSTILPVKVEFNPGFKPDYSKSTLSEAKIASFSLHAPEILFVHAFYDELKAMLIGKDAERSKLIANYLKGLSSSIH